LPAWHATAVFARRRRNWASARRRLATACASWRRGCRCGCYTAPRAALPPPRPAKRYWQAVNDFRAQPQGLLRLNVPRTAAYLLLMPLLPGFLQRYPGIQLDLVCDDTLVDIVSAGFDAGMRFGETLAADMVAVPVGPPMRFAVIASPGYLAQHGTPQHPAALAQHAGIRQRFGNGQLYAWELAKNGEALTVQPQGQLTLGEQALMVEAAAAGLGIAMVFEGYAAAALADGRVTRILADWCPAMPGLYLYYPSGRHLPQAMRLWIDYLKAALAA